MNLRKIIREEIEDLDWIKNTDPYNQNPDVGDIIEVHNMGDEREYLPWLGSYRYLYREGQFGDIITGEVVEYLQSNRFLLQEQNTGHRIIFPPYEEMENKKLKLLYILK
jgi:hypothetical protein